MTCACGRRAAVRQRCKRCYERARKANAFAPRCYRRHARMTLAEFGAVLGVSAQRVAQIERSALAKLRAAGWT